MSMSEHKGVAITSNLNNGVITIYAGSCKWQTGQSSLQAALFPSTIYPVKSPSLPVSKAWKSAGNNCRWMPNKNISWDKNEMNGRQWLEKRWHFYAFTYRRTRIVACIKSLPAKASQFNWKCPNKEKKRTMNLHSEKKRLEGNILALSIWFSVFL